jgi:SSS family solute:Na+ symporter
MPIAPLHALSLATTAPAAAVSSASSGVSLTLVDFLVFAIFLVVAIGVALFASRRERTGEDYFLGGRGLIWPMIGLSIVAANISTEQLVGMAGQGAGDVGLAVSNWQLIGSIGIIIVAFTLMPRFLKAGIYTMPEFLERRFSPTTRAIMAGYTVVIYVAILLTSVFYSGGLTIQKIFDVPLWMGVVALAVAATAYTAWGGLRAVAVADLFFGAALLAGGAYAFFAGLDAVGGWSVFAETNADRLHMIKPADDPNLPWTGVLGGMWIVLLYYCGLNQFIVQRALAAKSLGHAQSGMVFAAALWLLVPFFIVMPGMISSQLYADELGIGTADAAADEAFPTLIRNLIPTGMRGFIFAAIAGAVISSLASMLNSASTLFTMDIYKQHIDRDASDTRTLWIGRAAVVIFVISGATLATILDNLPNFKGVFDFIQVFQGYIWPGTVAAFLGGLLLKKAPSIAGTLALIVGPIAYGVLQFTQFKPILDDAGKPVLDTATGLPLTTGLHGIHFLLQTLIAWAIAFGVVLLLAVIRPRATVWELPANTKVDLKNSPAAAVAGAVVIAGVAVFYIVFW